VHKTATPPWHRMNLGGAGWGVIPRGVSCSSLLSCLRC
jgi:hypothetical protein